MQGKLNNSLLKIYSQTSLYQGVTGFLKYVLQSFHCPKKLRWTPFNFYLIIRAVGTLQIYENERGALSIKKVVPIFLS